jgi:DNA mismatch repair protein MutL
LSFPATIAPRAEDPAVPKPGGRTYASGPPPFPARPAPAEAQAAFALQSPAAAPSGPEGLTAEAFREARFEPVIQLYGTYLLARLENQFFLFDQHASDERSLFELLSAQAGQGAPARQPLLLPYVWESSPEAAAMVEGCLAHFEKLGFSLEPFGGGAVRVLAVPAFLGEGARARGLLEGLAEDLLSGRCPRGWDPLLIRAACLGSVRAGDVLAPLEMDRLIRRLQASPRPWTCPHGRPTFLRLSDADLAHRFRRT